MHHSSLLPKVRDNHIIVVSFHGWGKFQDLCILTRESLAKVVLGRLVDYTCYNMAQSVAHYDKIANLNEFNPHGLRDIPEAILGLGVDLYFTCYENELFEVGTARELPYELAHVGPHRLYLRRLIF